MDASTAILCLLFCAAAFLYASVGHAGASGYLGAMALVGVAPETMRPTALVLNILVAVLSTYRFWSAGHFSWRGLWPFLLGSVPLAFVGGALTLSGSVFKPLLGLLLFYAAFTLVHRKPEDGAQGTRVPPLVPAIGAGAGIGLLSGLTGTGGGIFLSPLLLLRGWAETRTTSGISAAFILCNSLAALAGNLSSTRALPAQLPAFVVAVGVGGLLGAQLGSRRFATLTLRRLLAVVLVLAGLKLVLAR